MASVAGGPQHNFQIDTGSSGMAIGAANAGNYQDYPCYGPGQFQYEPSGNLLKGSWYLLPVSLLSASTTDGKTHYSEAATTQCMVLVVDSVTKGAKGSTPTSYEGGMMGVSAKSENINYNALLNASIPGTGGNPATPLAPAYVLDGSSSGLTCTIGQTHTSGDGFTVVNLQPVAAPPLPGLAYSSAQIAPNPVNATWAMPTVVGTFENGSTTITVAAAFELDTGIDTMLVGVPAGTFPASFTGTPDNTGKATFVDGVTINITVLGSGVMSSTSNPVILGYTFTTASDNADPAPASVILMPPPSNTVGSMVRINTGIRPLSGYQYLYDAQNGVIGMQPSAS